MKPQKIAVLTDIHGNSIALQAVLDDILAQGGVDEYWVLGDLIALGPEPVNVLEMLAKLDPLRCVRGNTDRYVVRGDLPLPTLEELQADPASLGREIRVRNSMAWTAGAVTAAGWLLWLEQLPVELRIQLPDGTRVLAVHASPGADDGTGVNPLTPEEQLKTLLAGAQADLILVGHTHEPFDREIGGVRVVNPGSVSNPFPPDLRACYLFLTCDETGYDLQHRHVDYDHQAVIQAMQQARHPSTSYISRYMRGENKAPWRQ